MPLADLGVAEVERRSLSIIFFLAVTRTITIISSQVFRQDGWLEAISSRSTALVAGLLYFLLLPAVGCPLPDAMSE